MVRSILQIPEKKLQDLDYSVKLSAYERKLLKELCEILKPFEDATHLIQQQKNVTASFPLPVTVELKKKLHCLDSTYSNKMVDILLESISERLCKYEKHESLILATALDPRFTSKLQWCDENMKSNIENLLNTKASSVNLDDDDNDDDEETASPPMKKA